MSTWTDVCRELETRYGLKHERGDQWRGSSPFRGGSDGNSFVVKVAPDGEHGTYYDHKDSDIKGSLYELAKHLGLSISRAYTPVGSTKKGYTGLAEYAEAHGATEADYIAAGWSKEVNTIKGRKALEFKTRGGKRWRFIDGQKPSFISEPGYKQCWYGLDKAAEKAKETGLPLIFCNGEPSTIAGHKWNLPATTITSGEKGDFPKALLEQIKAVYPIGSKILIALDCDYTGATAAFTLTRHFSDLGYEVQAIDLALGESGDLADFCKLHTDKASETITTCKPLEAKAAPPEQIALPDAPPMRIEELYCSDIEALSGYISEMQGDSAPKAPPLINPFTFLHHLGGLGKIIPTGKVVYFASISGGTKTIGFETGWESCQEQGVHSIVYSPEWIDGQSNAVEFAARAVQRAGGVHFDSWLEHQLSMNEMAFNTAKPYGKALDPHTVGRSVNIAANLMRKPGRVFYIKNPGLSAQQLCQAVRLICEREAKNGIEVRVLWVDFAQLLWLQGGTEAGRVWIEVAINLLKDVAREKNLIIFINSQMRKNDADMARENGKIDASSMQWLSDQQCNLLFAFTPQYENGEMVTTLHPNDIHQRVGLLKGRVLKNSLAKVTDAEIIIPVDFSRLTWLMRTGT